MTQSMAKTSDNSSLAMVKSMVRFSRVVSWLILPMVGKLYESGVVVGINGDMMLAKVSLSELGTSMMVKMKSYIVACI